MPTLEPGGDRPEEIHDWERPDWLSDQFRDESLPARLSHIEDGPELCQNFIDFLGKRGIHVSEDCDRTTALPRAIEDIHRDLEPNYVDPDSLYDPDISYITQTIPINVVSPNRRPIASLVCFHEDNSARSVSPLKVMGADRWIIGSDEPFLTQKPIMPPVEPFSNAIGLAMYYGSATNPKPSINAAMFTPQSLTDALERVSQLAAEIDRQKSIVGSTTVREVITPSVIFSSLFLAFQRSAVRDYVRAHLRVGPYLGITHFTPPDSNGANCYDFELGVAFCGEDSTIGNSSIIVPTVIERRSIMKFQVDDFGLSSARVVSSTNRVLNAA